MPSADPTAAGPPHKGFVLYAYEPSVAAAAIFIAVFGILSLLHIWRLFRNRTWYFIPFVIGCLFEAVGYVGRVVSAAQSPNFTKNPFIVQTLLLLLGPSLFAASIYMVLSRVIVLLEGERYSVVSTRWLTKIFVLGDVLSFLAQAAGGAMLTTNKTAAGLKTGQNVILVGLAIQIIFFGLFIVAAVVFDVRLRRGPTARSTTLQTPWRALLWVLYSTSLAIMVRNIYRVAEYGQGSSGPAQTHEWFMYVFDTVPMAGAVLAWLVWHPSDVVSDRAAGSAEKGMMLRTANTSEAEVGVFEMAPGQQDGRGRGQDFKGGSQV